MSDILNDEEVTEEVTKDTKKYTWASPTNLVPVPYTIMVEVWNMRFPDDQINSRQCMEAAVKRAEFALIRELSNDEYMRDVLQETVSIANPNDHQRRLNRIVGLSEGMPESYDAFRKGKFNEKAE